MNENSENNNSSLTIPKGSALRVSIKNDDGSVSEVMELEPQFSFEQFEVSDQKDSVTLPVQYRIETFRPATVNLVAPLILKREFVRRLAESLGLFDSE